jgi:hypothetical protein
MDSDEFRELKESSKLNEMWVNRIFSKMYLWGRFMLLGEIMEVKNSGDQMSYFSQQFSES